jgi:4-alpha-glucanotransferase
MRHAGALRIDHVMGLRRQFWVPWGMSPAEGAYVAYPEQALMGILALESQRAGCLLIGEDLGTVPEGMRETLVEAGFLRSQVFYFERDHDGFFIPPAAYSDRALVTANTHDLPTLAGFWDGSDLQRRRRAGSLPDDAALERAQDERRWARQRMRERLEAEGLGLPHEGFGALNEAVHTFLARTPCPLLGVAVDDLAGEALELNLPGTPDPDGHNWSRRLRHSNQALASDPDAQRVLSRIRHERG